jgi:hypothetical protein
MSQLSHVHRMSNHHITNTDNAPNAACFWCRLGASSIALGKQVATTSAIFNLHSTAHDFPGYSSSSRSSRQESASTYWHIGIVITWLTGMYFHTGYLSNTAQWCEDPSAIVPVCTPVYVLAGQEAIAATNSGDYYTGVRVSAAYPAVCNGLGVLSLSD